MRVATRVRWHLTHHAELVRLVLEYGELLTTGVEHLICDEAAA